MITKRFVSGLNPVWTLCKDVYVKDATQFRKIKKAYVKKDGVFQQVYAENTPPAVGEPHGFWKYGLNSEFSVNDNTSNPVGISSPLFFTFWSTGGNYIISTVDGGSVRVNINTINTTQANIFESRGIFCNFTQGSRVVTTSVASALDPYNRVGRDGLSYRWNISAPGYTQADTTINLINPLNSTQFEINKNAQANGTTIAPTINRTYPGYLHDGYTRMISEYELSVSPGQVYAISAECTSITSSNLNTQWNMEAYTSPFAGQAGPFGASATSHPSLQYTDLSTQTHSVTVPPLHTKLRIGLTVAHTSGTPTNTPPSTPQWARFNFLRINRTG